MLFIKILDAISVFYEYENKGEKNTQSDKKWGQTEVMR